MINGAFGPLFISETQVTDMKLRVTKPNLYHNGKRMAVNDTITVSGEKIPTVYAGKVEPINTDGLTTDQTAGGDVAALQEDNDALQREVDNLNEEKASLSSENESLKQENDTLRADNAELREGLEGQSDEGSDTVEQNAEASEDTSAEADAKRKAWLIDEIESMTGKRPGGNSSLETLEKKFEEAKLAQE